MITLFKQEGFPIVKGILRSSVDFLGILKEMKRHFLSNVFWNKILIRIYKDLSWIGFPDTTAKSGEFAAKLIVFFIVYLY